MLKENAADTASVISCLETIGMPSQVIEKLARETGFVIRSARKVNASQFTCVLFCESMQGRPSFNDLAGRMATDEGIEVSRQAIGKRFGKSLETFLQSILAQVIAKRTGVDGLWQGRFTRLLLQDSTVVRLPLRLFEEYSGVSNNHQAVCNARIQVVYDVLAGQFVSFSIDPYSKNDLSAAPELEIREGDMVLRDRGYLIADEIQRHLDVGADCIYRHKHGTTYLDPETGKPINLLALLEKSGHLDMDVCLNNAAGTPVRLVAAPVDEETANNRRRKLKKGAHGHKPSVENLKMMSWTVLLSTLPREEAPFKKLLRLYGVRWRIETTFKAWKSNMHFADVHNVSGTQLRSIFTARLIMAVMLNNFIYRPACARLRSIYGKELSLMKLTKYMTKRPYKWAQIMHALSETSGSDVSLCTLSRYCSYDKRRRLSFNEEMAGIRQEWTLS